jgi:hypothetical protein
MSRAHPLRPALATFLAACFVLLGLAAQSPQLHELLCAVETLTGRHSASRNHGHESPGPDDSAPPSEGHDCAVTLFAAGTDAPSAFAVGTHLAFPLQNAPDFTCLLLSRTLRGPQRACGQPERTGPPAA